MVVVVAAGWIERRNPTAARVVLGFAPLNPTYKNHKNMSLSAVLPVNQAPMTVRSQPQ
jgi:hypothetical protein